MVIEGLTRPDFSLAPTAIAEATAPRPGTDSMLDFAVDVEIVPGVPRGDGTLDFRDRSFLVPVEAGTLLASYHPPGPSTDGVRVDGAPIIAEPGLDMMPAVGPGARLLDGSRIEAARDGVVSWDGTSALDVVDVVRHDGDVDLHSGHLKMEGAITVTGSVRDGFIVYGTGPVEILGEVEGATVLSGADIDVKGPVLGRSSGLVSATGHLRARRAQNARLRCGETIELQVDAIDTIAHATNIVVGGTVRGGSTKAELTLAVKDAGGPSATATLRAGVPFEGLEDAELAMALVARRNRGRKAAPRMGGRSRGGGALRANSAERAFTALQRHHQHERQRACEVLARVEVRGVAYEGVIIGVGERSHTLRETVRRAVFRLDPKTLEIRQEDLT